MSGEAHLDQDLLLLVTADHDWVQQQLLVPPEGTIKATEAVGEWGTGVLGQGCDDKERRLGLSTACIYLSHCSSSGDTTGQPAGVESERERESAARALRSLEAHVHDLDLGLVVAFDNH